MKAQVKSLFIGKPKPFKRPNLQSAIEKTQVSSILVGQHGIDGDEVANKKYHGGENRVLHFYPVEHYRYWSSHYNLDIFANGSIGENITTELLDETNTSVGDIFKINNVICQITEPRFPCGTIDMKYDLKGMHKQSMKLAKLGWFAKIIQPGEIHSTDEIILLESPYSELTLLKCINAINGNESKEVLESMIINPILSESWKQKAQKLLS